MWKGIAAATIAIAIMAGMAGCSKGTEPINQGEPSGTKSAQASKEDRKDLSISESGYFIDENGYGHYAVIVENENMGWAAQNVNLKVTGKDGAGAIVGTTDSYLTLIFANGKTAVCGTTYELNGAATLEFQIVNSTGMWAEEEMQQAEYDEKFFCQNINESVDEYGYTTVAGEVVNEGTGEFGGTSVNAVFRAADGTIVGGAGTLLSSVPSGSTLPFSIGSIQSVPDHATTEVYVDCGYPRQ